MRRTATSLASFIVAFCSIQIVAQSSADFGRADKYKAVKAVLQQQYEKGVLSSEVGQGEPGEYNLAGGPECQPPSFYMGEFGDPDDPTPGIPQHKNDDISAFILGAVSIVIWENDFRKLGVPDRIWHPVLQRYETELLSRKPTDAGVATDPRVMVDVLNERMAEAKISGPKFIFEPGCGAGSIDVRFSLKPADGQLFLIPVFLYKVCEAQHLNPLDFKSCDRWREIFSEHVAPVSGDYMYFARWTDGVARCGVLTYDDFKKQVDDHKDGPLIITKLRSPECSRVL